jgi:hypothetical protein
LQQRQTQNENTVIRAVRTWIQSQLSWMGYANPLNLTESNE